MKTYCINPDLLGKPCYEQVLNLARRFYCEKSGLPVPPGAPASPKVEITVNVPANSMAYVAFPVVISFENSIETYVARLGPVPDWLAEWAESMDGNGTVHALFECEAVWVDGKPFGDMSALLLNHNKGMGHGNYPVPTYSDKDGGVGMNGFYVADKPVVIDMDYTHGDPSAWWGDEETDLSGQVEAPHLRVRLVPHAWDVAEIEVQPNGTALNVDEFHTGAVV